jgi:hypothetical protein
LNIYNCGLRKAIVTSQGTEMPEGPSVNYGWQQQEVKLRQESNKNGMEASTGYKGTLNKDIRTIKEH